MRRQTLEESERPSPNSASRIAFSPARHRMTGTSRAARSVTGQKLEEAVAAFVSHSPSLQLVLTLGDFIDGRGTAVGEAEAGRMTGREVHVWGRINHAMRACVHACTMHVHACMYHMVCIASVRVRMCYH